MGEGGVIGAVPAITNAVADALAGLGANVNRTPLTPDRVLELIERAVTSAAPASPGRLRA